MSFVRERDAMLRDDESLPLDLRRAFAAYATVEPGSEERVRLLAGIERAAQDASRGEAAVSVASAPKRPRYLRLVVLSVLGLGVVGLWHMSRHTTPSAAHSASHLRPLTTVRDEVMQPSPVEVVAAANAPLQADTQTDPQVDSKVVPRPRQRKREAKVTSSAVVAQRFMPDPALELPMLTRARRVLAADPVAALKLTDEHLTMFPSGTFAQEREVIAIDALVRAGDEPAARLRAAAFGQRYPGSTHLERVRVILREP